MIPLSLDGKLALVTGSSRGIGHSIALELARAGADVVVNYRTNEEAAARTVAEIEALGRRAVAVRANMASPEEIESLFRAIGERFGGLDILVLNAATGRREGVEAMPPKVMGLVMAVNFYGPWLCVEHAVPLMKARGGGRIVAISTAGTHHTLPGYSVVAASKGALNVLTRYLAVELAAHNIVVNAVSPGLVMTDALAHWTNDAIVQRTLSMTPLGRPVKPEEVAYLTAFLCSERAQMICGEVIGITGGWMLKGL